jgi:hypothetical protein
MKLLENGMLYVMGTPPITSPIGESWEKPRPLMVGLLLKPASLIARRPIGDRAMTGAERQRKRRARLRREREEAAKKAGKPPDPSLKEEPSDNQT